MKKRIVLVTLLVVPMGVVFVQIESTAEGESLASKMRFTAEQQAESRLGVQSIYTGGGVAESRSGLQRATTATGYAKTGGGHIYMPTSGTQRIKDYVTTGGFLGPTGLTTSGDSPEVRVGTPTYDAKKLDLGTGGIIPSGSVFEPAYKIERLPESK